MIYHIMETSNSLVSVYTNLVVELIHDIADCYAGTRREASRCADYVRKRVACEGLKFLTSTLSTYGRAIDIALSQGTPLAAPFLRKKKGSSNPLFLGWLTERVFDQSGVELVNSDSLAVKHLRQVLYFMYKVPFTYDQQDCARVIRAFVETDEEVSKPLASDAQSSRVLTMARAIIARTLGSLNPLDIDPFHGPGAVSTGEKAWQKNRFKRSYRLIDEMYPPDRYFYYNLTHLCDELQEFHGRESLDTGTAKVVLVPKDARGPRLISCEPLEYQYMQQGLGSKIVSYLESSPLTRGHVNFRDQTINQRLAKQGSITGEFVTLDMKDASDRVSFRLVAELMPEGLMDALNALRSGRTKLPCGTVMRLNKFAPMGSALCFPVEALVFYSLAVASVVIHTGQPLRKALKRVWVYGDDIVCYREDYPAVTSQLPKFHLRFNEKKCCTHGSFRESCGGDYHKGVNVVPLRLKRVLSSRCDAATISSLVDLSNRLYERSYHRCARELEVFLRRYRIPYVDHERETFPGIAYTPAGRALGWDSTPPKVRTRYNSNLQRMETLIPTLRTRTRSRVCPVWGEMLRCVQTYKPFHPLSIKESARAYRYPVAHGVALEKSWTDIG